VSHDLDAHNQIGHVLLYGSFCDQTSFSHFQAVYQIKLKNGSHHKANRGEIQRYRFHRPRDLCDKSIRPLLYRLFLSPRFSGSIGRRTSVNCFGVVVFLSAPEGALAGAGIRPHQWGWSLILEQIHLQAVLFSAENNADRGIVIRGPFLFVEQIEVEIHLARVFRFERPDFHE
jgi:hypothetical protein